ncbi:hypothetical protein INQ51_08735 [Maribellus sp. CM-23]|uniref:hypothetical protein n=1 Tax=Maribellus sp. CM-23 TaxID=2781026 RepID=UPI001F396F9F|nr:hypothetical protein [Maribellus sp. CM-23]MCE4564393.1 hypothetical protein [Maribellus sp. CM-23]
MKAKLILLVLLIIGSTACLDQEIQVPANLKSASSSNPEDITSTLLNQINNNLEAEGVNYRIAMIEKLVTANGSDNGATIYSQIVGNKKLIAHFVPGDTRREWSGNGATKITYVIDQLDAVPQNGGLDASETTDAIKRGFGTWDATICSDLGLTQIPDGGEDIGVFAYSWWSNFYNVNGFPEPEFWQGSPFIFADIHQCGWGDLPFAPESGILGYTVTYVFVDDNGYTDINSDGLLDAAFRETYYSDNYNWQLPNQLAEGYIEVETVAVHEIGHCLSQGHFGTVLIKNDGTVKFSPRAVMNVVYWDVLTELQGTDIGGHCGIWDSWPYE